MSDKVAYSEVPTGGSYFWMDCGNMSLEEMQDLLEVRREQMLQEVEADGMTDDLQEEWCDLLKERDRVLRLRLKQENEQKLQEHFTTLLQLLVTIGQFDHSSTPTPMKAALYGLYKQLSANPPTRSKSTKPEPKVTVVSKENVPTPPPPPPITTVLQGADTPDTSLVTISPTKKVKLDDSDMEERPARPRSRRRKTSARSPLTLTSPRNHTRTRTTPGSKYTPRFTPRAHRTPKTVNSQDLRRRILTGKENLKSTPGLKRSPGGTPERPMRSVFSDNPNDIVSLALQKKFFNVRRLYGSPIKDEENKPDSREASFNLSID